MAYASLDDLTQYLGIDDSTADDGKLTQFLARAQAEIDNETRRVFEVVADSTRWHGAGSIQGRTLFLDGDCCAITSITNGNGATVAASEYYTLPRNRTPYYALELYSDSTVAWVDGGRSGGQIAVTGKWGYSLTAPADVVQATVRLAAWFYRQKDNAAGDQAIVTGDVTVLPARLPEDVRKLLWPYLRVLV